MNHLLTCFIAVLILPATAQTALPNSLSKPKPAKAAGPLRVHQANPRYFTDGSGKAVYLTGSHRWANLMDRGPSDLPPPSISILIWTSSRP